MSSEAKDDVYFWSFFSNKIKWAFFILKTILTKFFSWPTWIVAFCLLIRAFLSYRIHPPTHPPHASTHPPKHPPTHPSTHPSIHPSIHPNFHWMGLAWPQTRRCPGQALMASLISSLGKCWFYSPSPPLVSISVCVTQMFWADIPSKCSPVPCRCPQASHRGHLSQVWWVREHRAAQKISWKVTEGPQRGDPCGSRQENGGQARQGQRHHIHPHGHEHGKGGCGTPTLPALQHPWTAEDSLVWAQ